jgi:hypothetical protein
MVFFVILAKPQHHKDRAKKQENRIWTNVPALSPASPGMKQRTAGAKKQAGEPRKATSLWFQSRLRIDCSPHRMQRRTIAMLGESNKGTKQTEKSKSKRERTNRRKTGLEDMGKLRVHEEP